MRATTSETWSTMRERDFPVDHLKRTQTTGTARGYTSTRVHLLMATGVLHQGLAKTPSHPAQRPEGRLAHAHAHATCTHTAPAQLHRMPDSPALSQCMHPERGAVAAGASDEHSQKHADLRIQQGGSGTGAHHQTHTQCDEGRSERVTQPSWQRQHEP